MSNFKENLLIFFMLLVFSVFFSVKGYNMAVRDIGNNLIGDINKDGKVNQTDLDILSIIVKDKNVVYELYGDINGDGSVTVIDLAKLKSHLEGYTTLNELEFKNADLNNDCVVNELDLNILKSILEGDNK